MDSPSDLELLQRFQRGQAMAFEDLVLRHGPGIKGFALRMLRNREQAEEIYTETFLDRLRRRQTEARAWASVVEVYADRAVVPSPEASALLGERASELEKALGRLPAEHRDVLLLRTIHGLSAAETAQALGCSEDQVFSRLSYARKRLAELLSEGNQRQGRPA
jgi:RNA polymerase sigma-70 factor (ECF subfamily)